MNVSLGVDLTAFTKGMDDLQRTQIPFALTKALNATVLDVQVRERARLREVFTLRRPEWADRSIKVTHFAKKAEPYATLAIAPPGDKGDILGKFEDQTEKMPLGSHGIAVPVGARRNNRDLIVAAQRPKALHLHREGNRIVGDKGTYIVTLRDGRQLLLKRQKASRGRLVKTYDDDDNVTSRTRVGARAASVQVLYLFVPVARLHPTLEFIPNAAHVVDRVWAQRFDEAFAAAMATAR